MPPSDEPNPFTQRRLVISTLVVGVVVVIGSIFALTIGNTASNNPSSSTWPSSSSPGPYTSGSATTDASPEPGVADPAASVCGLPAGDQTVPTTPPEATWELVGTMAMPTAENIGPGVTSPEGIHSCYAHSPTGALFAVSGLMAAASVVNPLVLLETMAAPGTSRDAAIEQLKQQPESSSDNDMPDGYGGEVTTQVAGFRIISADPNNVTVEIAVKRTGGPQIGSYLGSTVAMTWSDGDWKWIVPLESSVRSLSSLAGFIPWAGA